jgi:UDP-galactopyranose mutase
MIFKEFDFVVVGCGITGITIARTLAEKNIRVLIVEERGHIGGNCYDEYDDHHLLVHKYGPHIFHTNHEEVWDFLSKFTKWNVFFLQVKAFVDGMNLPLPINLETVSELNNIKINSGNISNFLGKQELNDYKNAKEVLVDKFGEELYRKFFEGYYLKQWGCDASELSPFVAKRIPFRKDKNPNYFNDKYQAMPKQGYTKMFEKMLNHKNISLMLNTSWTSVEGSFSSSQKIIWTGPIDAFYKYKFGKLSYRTLDIEFEYIEKDKYQEFPVVSYPQNNRFTRITEYKYITMQQHKGTVISKEFSREAKEEDVKYYPIPRADSDIALGKYLEKSKSEKNVIFAGRLGTYKYMNMDQAVKDAFEVAAKLLAE